MSLRDEIKNNAIEIVNSLEEQIKEGKIEDVDTIEQTLSQERIIDGSNILENIKIKTNMPDIKTPDIQNLDTTNQQQKREFIESISINALSEKKFLELLEDKLLVLFSGLKSKNFASKEQQLKLVTSFLEYQLALIEERLKK